MGTVSVIYDLVGRDNVSGTFKKAGDSADTLGGKLSKVGAVAVAAGAAIAAGAAAIGVESVKAAVTFEASMEKIHTQAGASQAAVDSLTKSVLAMAPSTEQGPQQLADALYHLKSVGLDNAQAMTALKTASNLAAVGGANLEDTTNALAGAWRSGISGAQNFGQAAATVNAIIGAGNMTMSDLVAALGTGILPAAKTFGVSLSSVGSALALMTDEGVPAEDAATRLRMSLSLLGAPSLQASKYLAQIGLTGTDLATAMRGPQGIIGAIALLKTKLDASGDSASQQAQVISRAFGGGQSSSAIMTMLNNLDTLEKKQVQINTTTGKYGDAVAAQRKTASAQFDLLKSSVDTLGIRLGLDLLPPVTNFVSFLAKTAVPAVTQFAGKIAGMLPVAQVESSAKKLISDIESVLGIGGKSTAKAKPVLNVPYKLTEATGYTAADLLQGPVTMPVQLRMSGGHMNSQLPQQAAATAKSATSTLTSALKSVNWGNVLADVIRGAVSGAQQIGAAILTLLGKIDWTSLGGQMAYAVVGLAVGLVDNLVQAILSEAVHHPLDMIVFLASIIPIGRVAGVIVDLLDKIPLLGPLAKFLLGPIAKVGDLTEAAFGKLFGKLWDLVEPLWDATIGKANKWLLGKGEDLLLALWYGAEDGWRFLADWIGKLNDMLLGALGDVGSWLLKVGGKILDGLWTGAEAVFGPVLRWFGEYYGWIYDVFRDSAKWLLDVGGKILGGLWNGAKAGWSTMLRWLGTIYKLVIAPFVRVGTWLLGEGEDLLLGLARGAGNGWRSLLAWLDKIQGWITGVFLKASVWLLSKGEDVITGLYNGAGAAWKLMWKWVTRIDGWIVGYFAKAGTWLLDAGSSLISGLKDGITNEFKGIASWVKKSIVDPLVNWVKHWFGIHSPSTVMAGLGGHLITGLLQGLMSTSAGDIATKVFGSLPSALGAIVEKGLVSLTALPGKALSALGSLGSKGLNLLGKTGGLLGHLFGLGGGGASGPVVDLGKAMASALGWTGSQWNALYSLWNGESGWNVDARNPSSGAYGIPQALPPSKMGTAGGDWLTNPATQIEWGLGYINQVYGSPLNAYSKWLSRSPHWYGTGGKFAAGQLIGVGERGPELAVFDKPGSILSPEQSAALLTGSARGGDGGGMFEGNLYLDSGELLGLVRGEIRKSEKETARAVKSGSGRRQ